MNPQKLDEAKAFGATHACTPDEVDQMKVAITGGDGFDYALECIGKPVTMRAAYDQTRRGGTTVIVGVGRMDEMVSFSAFELFFNEKTLVGSYYGGTDVRADFHKLLRLYRAGKLDLDRMITRRIKIDEINDAMRAMERGEVVRQVIEF
jgi:S-(hydroxymethyl)glutathione dehydrogenase/alcohol dehydrogenase